MSFKYNPVTVATAFVFWYFCDRSSMEWHAFYYIVMMSLLKINVPEPKYFPGMTF